MELFLVSLVAGAVLAVVFGLRVFMIFAISGVLLGFLSTFDDHKDAEKTASIYCNMVKTWVAEAKAGVPPEDRSGWPPYDGECTNDQNN